MSLHVALGRLLTGRNLLMAGGLAGLAEALSACGGSGGSGSSRTPSSTAHEREVRENQANCSHLGLSSIYPEDVDHVRSYDCSGVISEYLYIPGTTSEVASLNDSYQCMIARMWNLDNYYKCAPCTQYLTIDAGAYSYIDDSVIQGGLYCEATAPTDDSSGYYVNHEGD
ncbi:MAG: hypothetical protein HY542_04535 [Deltaproteobacteria bacterium]|nr:hypothetical protein [Deltaproteobacteria bacterium]